MKYIPNILTISRIILAIISVIFLKDRTTFFILLILCGLTDIFDGIIARKTKSTSNFGAILDSIADIFMFGMVTTGIIVFTNVRIISFIPYIIITAAIRLLSIVISIFKYRKIVMIHTWANKLTGVGIFITLILFIITDEVNIFVPICILAIISGIEELVINIISDKVDLNKKSIFIK